jgi:hypothetical protein
MLTATYLLLALIKTSGEGGMINIPYETEAACLAAGERLEAEFEALPLEHEDGSIAKGHPRVIWMCFEAPDA